MIKQELSFSDKKEVCKVVLHRLIQVSLAQLLESWALTQMPISQMCFPTHLSHDCVVMNAKDERKYAQAFEC